MPFVLIMIPAFWAMFMVAIVLEGFLAAVLEVLPLAISLFVHDYAFVFGGFGVFLAVVGNGLQLSELLRNRNTARDMVFMLMGASLVLMTFLVLPEWPLVVGRGAFALLTLFCPAAIFGRAIMDKTETAFASIVMAFLCVLGLFAATWLMFF